MISRSVQLSLLALVSASVCEAVPAKRTPEKTYNLKALEHRIQMHEKKAESVSAEFKTVQEGMKKGNYHYDKETARTVAREVFGDRMNKSQYVR